MKYLSFILVLMVGMSSCDTRDDYFLEHGDAPIIEMKTANDTLGVEYWEGKRYRVIEVGFGKPDTLTFSINDPYGKECTYDLRLSSIPSENAANGVKAQDLVYCWSKEICQWQLATDEYSIDGFRIQAQRIVEPMLKVDKTSGKAIFSVGKKSYIGGKANDYITCLAILSAGDFEDPSTTDLKRRIVGTESFPKPIVNEIPFSKEISARYTLKAKNKIGVESEEYVIVKIKPNRQPLPTIKATCVDKESNKYKITVGGTDPDGDRVVKWSYLFDCEPFKIGSKNLYANASDHDDFTGRMILNGCLYYDEIVFALGSYDNVEGQCFYLSSFGKSKKDLKEDKVEIDFIEPTTRREVYHVFQTKGEHTISVRCKDENGLWSDYITEKIYIE